MSDKKPALYDDPAYGHAVREAARVNKIGGLGRDEPSVDVNVLCIAIDRMAEDIVRLRNLSGTLKPDYQFTRDMAIERLRSWGHDARARSWSMGETILIPMGLPKTQESGIVTYAGVIYIYPDDDRDRFSKWGVMDCGNIDRTYDSLAQAVDGAHEYIKFILPYMRPR